MEAFASSRWTYRRHPPAAALLNVILSVNEIGVAPRSHGVPDFKRDRMVSILDAFSRELALPPIEVVEAKWNGYRYWLYPWPSPTGRVDCCGLFGGASRDRAQH